ncbi:hypothetical protein [Allomesorhizobium camelthorni]|uniref:DUF3168 domain-containing protein n=1 Tax=Allomesorhizobium camelthorni TaxID=475069 RepID=A0A6G4W7X7_9HYPH|nr:hypothetical protein [Mesorhizobium camelthorni]NGO50428.1 hypothetical protein [Mesorhizobium camelthorni]
MPDYAGAKAAIRSRLETNWTTTRITYQNETPADPWPPVDGSGVLQPWANLEIVGSGSRIVGQGTPGNHVWRYDGIIYVHVFTPVGAGIELGDQYAVAIGEIFRAAKFYDATPGFGVRTLAPSIDDADSGDDDGNWSRTTMHCDFTYWHRG